MIRVIVTGGRNYADRAHVRRVICELHAERGIATLVQGGATGADTLAAQEARRLGIEVVTVKADWRRNGKGAGPERNQRMVDRGADLLVAFPGGVGTNDCVGRAKRAGILVLDEREGPGCG